MSDDRNEAARAFRRAVSELSDPAPALFDAFSAAERLPLLEGALPLADVDPFGDLVVPERVRSAEAEAARRRSLALDRLPARPRAARRPAPAHERAAAGAAPVAVERPAERAPAVAPPVFSFRSALPNGVERVPAERGTPEAHATHADAGAPPAAGVTERARAAPVDPDPPAVSAPDMPAAAGALTLLSELVERILAPDRVRAERAPRGSARAAAPPAVARAVAARGLAPPLEGHAATIGAAPAAGGGVPVSAGLPDVGLNRPANGAPPVPPAAHAHAPAHPSETIAAPPASPDPDTLARLVNDALVEQARRHGVDLG